jgi:hypothetical protein
MAATCYFVIWLRSLASLPILDGPSTGFAQKVSSLRRLMDI